jgi:hypothetical protein
MARKGASQNIQKLARCCEFGIPQLWSGTLSMKIREVSGRRPDLPSSRTGVVPNFPSDVYFFDLGGMIDSVLFLS